MNYTSNMGMNMPDENDKFSIEHFNTNTQALDIVGKPDEYKNTKTYAVGDLCIHNNILYKCIIAVETAEEFNAEKWEVTSLCKEEIANKTAIAELNENLTWQLAGEVKGKKEILIPASAKEIYVEVGSDTSKLGTVTIPVIRLSEKDIKYNLYELYLNGQQYVRSIVVSKLRVIIGECKTADKDASSSTVTTMYYR